MSEKIFAITVDDWSAPSGCSGTSLLFGTSDDISTAMDAYREWRLAKADKEKKSFEESLIRQSLEMSIAWQKHFDQAGRVSVKTIPDVDLANLPQRMMPDMSVSFELDEEGNPITTASEHRLANTANNFAHAALALLDDSGTYDGAWRRFAKGEENVRVSAGLGSQRFAVPVDIVASTSLTLPADEGHEVLNVWSWPYWLKWELALVDVAWVRVPGPSSKQEGDPDGVFLRICKYDFTGFAIKGVFGDDYSAPWSFWGMPGLLSAEDAPPVKREVMRHGRKTLEDFIPSCGLSSRLYLPDRYFTSRQELEEDATLSPEELSSQLDLTPLCLAIVGDG